MPSLTRGFITGTNPYGVTPTFETFADRGPRFELIFTGPDRWSKPQRTIHLIVRRPRRRSWTTRRVALRERSESGHEERRRVECLKRADASGLQNPKAFMPSPRSATPPHAASRPHRHRHAPAAPPRAASRPHRHRHAPATPPRLTPHAATPQAAPGRPTPRRPAPRRRAPATPRTSAALRSLPLLDLLHNAIFLPSCLFATRTLGTLRLLVASLQRSSELRSSQLSSGLRGGAATHGDRRGLMDHSAVLANKFCGHLQTTLDRAQIGICSQCRVLPLGERQFEGADGGVGTWA